MWQNNLYHKTLKFHVCQIQVRMCSILSCRNYSQCRAKLFFPDHLGTSPVPDQHLRLADGALLPSRTLKTEVESNHVSYVDIMTWGHKTCFLYVKTLQKKSPSHRSFRPMKTAAVVRSSVSTFVKRYTSYNMASEKQTD